MHVSSAEEILNKRSGWKALTGTTMFSRISASSDPACRLAFEIFVDRIVGFVGSYYTKLGGKVDALVFAGGVGEHDALLRQNVVDACECLGFGLDPTSNREVWLDRSSVIDIGQQRDEKHVLVCRTDEQVSIAASFAGLSTPLRGIFKETQLTICLCSSKWPGSVQLAGYENHSVDLANCMESRKL